MTPPIDGSRTRSLATAALFLGLAVFAFWATRQSEAAWMGMPIPGDPGPYFLIRLCLWVVGVAGVVIGLLTLLSREEAPARADGPTGLRGLIPGAALILSLIAMPTAMTQLGTLSAVAIFATGWIFALSALRFGPTLRIAATALAFGLGAAGFVELVFVRLLTLPLP